MNVKFAILSTIAIISASSSVQAAEAQNARWQFAPNVWKKEESRLPRGYGQPEAAAFNPHSVQHGSMPKGNSLLGFDPSSLHRPAPRVAPIANTTVAAKPSWTNVIPMLNPLATPVANKGQFGNPINSNPPVVASLPPQAKAQPRSLAPASVNTGVSGKINPPRHSATVAGRLARPARGLAARPASPIQSYGNMGYTSGSTAPTSSGFSTNTNVSGKVLYRSTQKH